MIEIRETEEFSNWLMGLRDARAKARIAERIRRLALGNPGDVAPVGDVERPARDDQAGAVHGAHDGVRVRLGSVRQGHLRHAHGELAERDPRHAVDSAPVESRRREAMAFDGVDGEQRLARLAGAEVEELGPRARHEQHVAAPELDRHQRRGDRGRDGHDVVVGQVAQLDLALALVDHPARLRL